MLKKFILTILLIIVGNLAVTPYIYASGNSEENVNFAKKVKMEIAKLGVGTDARIKVKLKDGTKLKGYVSEIKENSFTIIETKNGNAASVLYSQAKQVKGNNLSSEVIIGIGVVAFLVILLLVTGSAS